TPGPTLSLAQETFLAVMTVALYGTFLSIQTDRHRQFFIHGEPDSDRHATPQSTARPLRTHAILLVLYMAPLVYLAEQFANQIDYLLQCAHAPGELGGVVMPVLMATPQAMAAVRASSTEGLEPSID